MASRARASAWPTATSNRAPAASPAAARPTPTTRRRARAGVQDRHHPAQGGAAARAVAASAGRRALPDGLLRAARGPGRQQPGLVRHRGCAASWTHDGLHAAQASASVLTANELAHLFADAQLDNPEHPGFLTLRPHLWTHAAPTADVTAEAVAIDVPLRPIGEGDPEVERRKYSIPHGLELGGPGAGLRSTVIEAFAPRPKPLDADECWDVAILTLRKLVLDGHPREGRSRLPLARGRGGRLRPSQGPLRAARSAHASGHAPSRLQVHHPEAAPLPARVGARRRRRRRRPRRNGGGSSARRPCAARPKPAASTPSLRATSRAARRC